MDILCYCNIYKFVKNFFSARIYSSRFISSFFQIIHYKVEVMFDLYIDTGQTNCTTFFRTKTNDAGCNPCTVFTVKIHKWTTCLQQNIFFNYSIVYGSRCLCVNILYGLQAKKNGLKRQRHKSECSNHGSNLPESPKHESFAFIPPAHTCPSPRFTLYALYAFLQSLISAMGKRTFNLIELDTSPYRLNTVCRWKKKKTKTIKTKN